MALKVPRKLAERRTLSHEYYLISLRGLSWWIKTLKSTFKQRSCYLSLCNLHSDIHFSFKNPFVRKPVAERFLENLLLLLLCSDIFGKCGKLKYKPNLFPRGRSKVWPGWINGPRSTVWGLSKPSVGSCTIRRSWVFEVQKAFPCPCFDQRWALNCSNPNQKNTRLLCQRATWISYWSSSNCSLAFPALADSHRPFCGCLLKWHVSTTAYISLFHDLSL